MNNFLHGATLNTLHLRENTSRSETYLYLRGLLLHTMITFKKNFPSILLFIISDKTPHFDGILYVSPKPFHHCQMKAVFFILPVNPPTTSRALYVLKFVFFSWECVSIFNQKCFSNAKHDLLFSCSVYCSSSGFLTS